MDCIFCKIVAKSIPSDIIYEDETMLAFSDLHPQAPIHKLLIPKQHISTLNDIQPTHQGLVGSLLVKASELAQQLRISENGYRLVFNCNQDGGQAVFHLHLHLLGGRAFQWPPG